MRLIFPSFIRAVLRNEGLYSRACQQLPHCSGTVLLWNNNQMTWNYTWLPSTQSYFAPHYDTSGWKQKSLQNLQKPVFFHLFCYWISGPGFHSVFPYSFMHPCTSSQLIPVAELAKLHQIWFFKKIGCQLLTYINKNKLLVVKQQTKNPTSRQIFLWPQQRKKQGDFTPNSMHVNVKHID